MLWACWSSPGPSPGCRRERATGGRISARPAPRGCGGFAVSGVQIISVGAAQVAGQDDPGGLLAVRALVAEGAPVASRQLVDDDEGAVEAALGAALGQGLAVVLATPGGSSGEVVRRVLARLTGARLCLSDRFLELLQQSYTGRGQAMPRRMDRLALLPQGAQVWADAAGGEPGWFLEADGVRVVVLPADSPHLAALIDQHLRPLARQGTSPGGPRLVRILRATGIT